MIKPIKPLAAVDAETRAVVDAMLGIIKYLADELPESVEGTSDPSRIRSREELRRSFEAHEVWQDEERRQHVMSMLGLWDSQGLDHAASGQSASNDERSGRPR
jgi:hypothetical protein